LTSLVMEKDVVGLWKAIFVEDQDNNSFLIISTKRKDSEEIAKSDSSSPINAIEKLVELDEDEISEIKDKMLLQTTVTSANDNSQLQVYFYVGTTIKDEAKSIISERGKNNVIATIGTLASGHKVALKAISDKKEREAKECEAKERKAKKKTVPLNGTVIGTEPK